MEILQTKLQLGYISSSLNK